MAKRLPVPNPDLWGWPSRLRVESQTLTPPGDTYAVQAVYVNDTLVGHVVGRSNWDGKREWDYVVGAEAPMDHLSQYRLDYTRPSRQHAVVALVEKGKVGR